MNKTAVYGLVAAVLFAALPMTQAFAFGTVSKVPVLGQDAEHEKITRAALSMLDAKTLEELAGTSSNFGAVGAPDDPVRGLLIASTNRLAFVITLVPRERYQQERAAGRETPGREYAPQRGTPYGMYREPLLSRRGMPCNPPPWGTLAAVDLTTGDVRWEVPLGVSPELSTLPQASEWGSVNLGGSLVTAGGLVFVAAARDSTLRAFDVETGTVLWSAELPASAQATPMTYRSATGKQFVVIAAGGHSALRSKMGDYVVAFSLP